MSTKDAPLPASPVLDGPPPHLLVVRAPYYRDITRGMTEGALRIPIGARASHELLEVAGSFEMPQAICIALRGPKRFDGFVALGCIFRGDTDHYDHICPETMAGLMSVALQHGIALGSGVLIVHAIQQARFRSGEGTHNKGVEAAAAALSQVTAARRLGAA
jgi:6,7-dimethyl-8-ribityllumazine synthase